MQIYVSGPMRGIPDHNFPAFNRASALLRARGHTVDNPAENLVMDTVEEYMRADLTMVLRSDAIGVLPGWEKSVGAAVELQVAAAVGIPIYHVSDLLLVREWGEPTTVARGVQSTYGVRDGQVFLDAETGGTVHDVETSLAAFTPIHIELQPLGAPLLQSVEKTGPIESVCQEADRLVSTDRQGDYGHPLDDFTKTAKMWSAIFGIEIDAAQVPLAMIAVKISRELNKPKRDNLVDICGYAKTLDLVHDRRAELEALEKDLWPMLQAQDALQVSAG